MHKLTFYPVGNGDSSQIHLANGKRLLFDFRQHSQASDSEHPTIDLDRRLREELAADKRSDVDVFAITHGDKDHIEGSTEFFELDHAAKYQGKDRIKVKELWVPAALVLDSFAKDSEPHEAKIWRQEARHRLIEGYGVRVFSKPAKLKAFLESKGVSLESREHLITDAGELVPGFSLATDGVEFFCHSPFIKHCDEGEIQRNASALIFQVRLSVDGTVTNYFAVGDSESDVLGEIVEITEAKGNDDRLDWDIYNIPHHCSYLALGPDKGKNSTQPTDPVDRLLEHGQRDAYVISSSWPIKNDKLAYEQTQPPHVQAKNTYVRRLEDVDGREFMVTMEHKSETKPQPIEIQVTGSGVKLSAAIGGAAILVHERPPRAGVPYAPCFR